MKSTELRIGNYLQGKTRFVKVTKIYSEHAIGIGSGDPYYVSGENPCLTPIPLTEEWLLKFGFKKNIDTSYSRNDISLFIDKRLKTNLFLQENMNDFKWFGYECKIQYVHQLQNLYFALTGEELTINEQ
jgi:hypothetical protein